MRNIVIITIICIQFVCSCAESTKNTAGQKVLTVPEEPTINGQTFLKNFELDAIVPIETTDNYLVSNIQRAIRYKDNLILLNRDPSYIFVIDIATGKVKTFINRQGQGAGESRQIIDIAVDESQENILVYNDYKKLLFFDMNGLFIKEEKLECGCYNMLCYDGKLLLNERREGYSCYPYEFNLYDIAKKTLKTIGDNKRVDFHVRVEGRSLVESKNIWVVAPLDYNLYRLNNGEFEIPYTLSVKKTISQRLIDKSLSDIVAFINEIDENKIIFGLSSPVETDRFMLVTSNQGGIIMINKQTSELTWEQFLNEDKLGLPYLSNFFPIDRDENRVMFIIAPDDWLREIAAHPERIAPKWQEQISKMNIVEDSNPILLFYREKKD